MLVLPPPQPAAANPRKSTIILNALASARRFGCVVEAHLPPSTNKKTKIAAKGKRVGTRSVGNENRLVGSAKGRAAAAPVVVTITVNGVAVPPETWSVDGPCMLAPAGAPP